MAVADATLSHPSVNSGTAVNLQMRDIQFGFKCFREAKPVEGKFDISSANFLGFENPGINITGVIDIDNVGSNTVTQDLLTSFACLKSTTPLTLTVVLGTSGKLGGRPSGGYSTGGSNTLASTISVVVDSFDIQSNAVDSVSGQRVDYSLTLIETI